ncbi:RING-H2 zinc finger protein, partial [Trifolium medium]|nr:RING-H2 zinc finger protein [Trifolium medium]
MAHHNHHPQNLGRSIFLKRSRYYYGHQYSRRNSANHSNASSSRSKGMSSFDDKLSFK